MVWAILRSVELRTARQEFVEAVDLAGEFFDLIRRSVVLGLGDGWLYPQAALVVGGRAGNEVEVFGAGEGPGGGGVDDLDPQGGEEVQAGAVGVVVVDAQNAATGGRGACLDGPQGGKVRCVELGGGAVLQGVFEMLLGAVWVMGADIGGL